MFDRTWSSRPFAHRAPFTVLVAVLIGWAGLIAVAPAASAHAVLLFSAPSFDGALPDSPETVNLVFNEAVSPGSATVTLSDAQGRPMPVGPVVGAQGNSVLSAAIGEDLAAGIYQVDWDVTGADGHGAAGEFRFAVGVSPPLGDPSFTAEPIDWGAAGRKGLLLAGFAISLGGFVGERLGARSVRKHPGLHKVRSWTQLGAVVGLTSALASGLVLVGGNAYELIGGPPGWRVIAEVVGFASAWALLRVGRGRQAVWALLVVAVADGFASHSDLALPGVGLVLTSVHFTAAGIWVGALLHVVRAAIAWRLTPGVPRELTLAYARLTVWLFGVVVFTGTAMTVLLVPISTLTSTDYGRVLLLKVALVLVVTVLALIGRRALRRTAPRPMHWAARIEVVTLGVVLGAAAILVSTATPGSVPAAAPPPLPTGTAVPAGGLAGQVGVNAVASEGQLVVRLSTPQPGNAYEPGEPTSYTLSGSADSTSGRTDLDFRPCGEGCFVTPHAWSRGDNVISLRADASGWRGGELSSLISWPATGADVLIDRTVQTMGRIPTLTVYETGTSEGGTDLPPPYRVSISGADYVDSAPYGAGVAPVAVSLPAPGGKTRLLLGFPASGIFVDLTLDETGRITDEILASPKHVFRRRLVYEP